MRQLTCDDCDGDGLCAVHRMRKYARWTELCRTRPDYREAWDEGRGPGQIGGSPREHPRRKPVRHSTAAAADSRAPGMNVGPGTELKLLLRKLFIREKAGCGCEGRAALMDQMGADWCEKNLETIVDWLQAEARRRRLPFFRSAGRILVHRAIRNARKKLEMLK